MAVKVQGCTVIDNSRNACISSLVFSDSSTMTSAPAASPCIVLQGTATGLCCFTIPSGYTKIRFYAVGGGACGTYGSGCGGGGGAMAWGCLSVTPGCVICACFTSGCTMIYYNGMVMAAACGAATSTSTFCFCGATSACICSTYVTCGGTASGGNALGAGGASSGSPLGTGYNSICWNYNTGCGGGAGIGGSDGWAGGGGAGSAASMFITGGAGPNGNGRCQYDFGDASCCYFTDPLLSLAVSPGVLNPFGMPAIFAPCACCCWFTQHYSPYIIGASGGPGAGGSSVKLCGLCVSCCCYNGALALCCLRAGNGGLFAGGGSALATAEYSINCKCICTVYGGNGGLFGGGGSAGSFISSFYGTVCCVIGGCGGCGGGGGIAYSQCYSCTNGAGGQPAVVYYLK